MNIQTVSSMSTFALDVIVTNMASNYDKHFWLWKKNIFGLHNHVNNQQVALNFFVETHLMERQFEERTLKETGKSDSSWKEKKLRN